MHRIPTVILCLSLLTVLMVSAATAAPKPEEPISFDAVGAADPALRRDADRAGLLVELENDRRNRRADAADLVTLGQLYLAEGQLVEAEAAAREALDGSPDFAPAHTLMGDIYWQSGWAQSAVASYRNAAAVDARDPVCRYRLVHALAASGQATLAETECQGFLADHQDGILFVGLGEALEAQQRYREAFGAYGQALVVDGSLATAHSHRAGLFCREAQYAAAEQECLAALALDPEDGLAHAYLGVACGHQRDYWRAYSHAVKAERAGIDMQPVWDLLNRAE